MLPLLMALLLSAPPEENRTDFTPQAKLLMEQIVAGKNDDVVAAFSDVMKKALPAEKLDTIWKAVIAQHGPWQRIVATRTEAAGKYAFVFVTCEFEIGKIDFKFVFDTSDGKIAGWFLTPAGSYQPPAYADPAKFDEVDVKIGAGKFLLTLPGTLSLPKGDGPFPAVLLVHGSGPHDRDETIGPNKPFRDLAHGLASRGIAVLRYEKRTKQHAAAMALVKVTVKEEVVDDAVEAIELLAKQEKIDPKRIYLLGHSLGGKLIPRFAARQEKIAGFISLAGSLRPLEDHVLEQTKYILELDGALSEEDEKTLEELREKVALVKSDKLTDRTPAKDLPLAGAPASYWLDLRNDRPDAAKEVKQPLLILQGERDYQVTMEDFAQWKSTLADRDNVTFRSYPQLNHLFAPGEGKSRPAEYTVETNVAEEVIVDIARWIDP